MKSGLNINKELRLKILKMYYKAGAGHIACSLSCTDLLYEMFNKKTKDDRLILSKGHAAVALYVCLEHFGELTEKQLESFYQDGTRLCAHPAPALTESAPFATGSLGHGLPAGCGMALAKKIKKQNGKVMVLMSDGETNEGTTWEAANFAKKHQLDNLIVIIDKNGIQGFDFTENVLGNTAEASHWSAFGFIINEIDGHDPKQIKDALAMAYKINSGSPHLIIANTIKGKGVSFMENTVDWHYWPMNEEQYEQAIREIKAL